MPKKKLDKKIKNYHYGNTNPLLYNDKLCNNGLV